MFINHLGSSTRDKLKVLKICKLIKFLVQKSLLYCVRYVENANWIFHWVAKLHCKPSLQITTLSYRSTNSQPSLKNTLRKTIHKLLQRKKVGATKWWFWVNLGINLWVNKGRGKKLGKNVIYGSPLMFYLAWLFVAWWAKYAFFLTNYGGV